MCRNIHVLFNFDPPATEEEIRDAATQYVRKISGFTKPSQANTAAFAKSIDEVTQATQRLVDSLTTDAKPHNREEEAHKAHLRALKRFG